MITIFMSINMSNRFLSFALLASFLLFFQCSFAAHLNEQNFTLAPDEQEAIDTLMHMQVIENERTSKSRNPPSQLIVKKKKGSMGTSKFSPEQRGPLEKWLEEHCNNPYPTEEEKLELVKITGLNLVQINNWFSNKRRRDPRFQGKSQQRNPLFD